MGIRGRYCDLGYVKSLLSGFRDVAPSAASRVRRARSCHRDNRHAERVAGFPRLKGLDPRSAIARPRGAYGATVDGRPAPRGRGAGVTSVELLALPIRQDSTANSIPESHARQISNFCGVEQKLAGESLTKPIIL